MAILFSTRPGMAVQLPTNESMPLRLQLEGWGGFDQFKAIITQVGLESQGNFQMVHTLRDFIYVYVFGERVAQASVSGIAFAHTCPGNSGSTGPEQILNYYNRYRISQTGRPITLQIGTSPVGRIRGFLTSIRVDITDPSQHLSQFSMRFHFFPRRARNS